MKPPQLTIEEWQFILEQLKTDIDANFDEEKGGVEDPYIKFRQTIVDHIKQAIGE